MAEAPLLSIITPAFNAAAFLPPLIASVLHQSERRFEHLIIDDGSADGGATAALLRRYHHLRSWTRANRGQYATMNEGLTAATGTWVGFISADDLYAVPGTFAAVAAFARAHPNVDVIHGRWLTVDPAGRPLPVQRQIAGSFPPLLYPYLNHISHCALFVRRAALLAHNLTFREDLRFTGDGDWILRLAAAGLRFGYLDRVLAGYRVHPGQTMARARRAAIRAEQAEVWRSHGYRPAAVLLAAHLLDGRARLLRARHELRRGGVLGLARATGERLRSRSGSG